MGKVMHFLRNLSLIKLGHMRIIIIVINFLFLVNSTLFSQSSCKNSSILPGAARTEKYLPLLKNKRVGVFANQTSTVNGEHLVDLLLSKGVQVKKIFSPEHGFRGTADAGEEINNQKDTKTGLPIISLY